MNIYSENKDLIIEIPRSEYDLSSTLDCGQCFRFKEPEPGSFRGVAHGRILDITQTEEAIRFKDTTADEFNSIWCEYFDFNGDYAAMKSHFSKDETLSLAIGRAGGIRILKQDSFETLISFLISQNNNIPRIKGSIERLCQKYGTPIAEGFYSFPTPEAIARAGQEGLSDLGLGYRDRYLADCAQRVTDGRLELTELCSLPIADARKKLLEVTGIGIKVAECSLLFGFHRLEAFPVDTWMKKVLERYYPNGFPEEFTKTAGVAQQYLFHYIRLLDTGK